MRRWCHRANEDCWFSTTISRIYTKAFTSTSITTCGAPPSRSGTEMTCAFVSSSGCEQCVELYRGTRVLSADAGPGKGNTMEKRFLHSLSYSWILVLAVSCLGMPPSARGETLWRIG